MSPAWPQRLSATSRHILANTGWMLGSQVTAALCQGLQFVIVGKLLGPAGFGAYAAAMALVYAVVPFAAWGSGNVLIMHVARDHRAFPIYWGNALLLICGTASLFALLLVPVSHWLLPAIGLPLVLTLCIAELLFGRLLDVAAQAFQAFEQLRATAVLGAGLNVTRLGAAVAWVALTIHRTPESWALFYCGATAVCALIAVVWVTVALGWPLFAPRSAVRHIKLGALFSVSLAAQNMYNDLDKVMLARLSTVGAVGIYTAAYRIVTLAFAPVSALLYSIYARFFRAGQEGVSGSLAFATRPVLVSVGYGAWAAVCLFLLAPLVPLVLGGGYSSVAPALRWLCLLPLLKALHYIAADTLTGADRQGLRCALQVGIALLNVIVNLWLIPRFGWLGAAWASLLSDGLLAVSLWVAVYLALRRSRPHPSVPAVAVSEPAGAS